MEGAIAHSLLVKPIFTKDTETPFQFVPSNVPSAIQRHEEKRMQTMVVKEKTERIPGKDSLASSEMIGSCFDPDSTPGSPSHFRCIPAGAANPTPKLSNENTLPFWPFLECFDGKLL